MRYLYERLKNTTFGKKYLADGAFINFLRRGKHFLGRIKRKLQARLKENQRCDNLLAAFSEYLEQGPKTETDSAEEIDVIIPIYNGYEYLVKLFEDLPKTRMKCRFILVDDKSTQKQVHDLEQDFARKHENVVLLENEENYGFVKSVNRGLSVSKNHVALVNTDTELPKGWLERLMYPILHEEKVASTTPYTNSGTIFSFPDFCCNNQIYRGKDVDTLDSYFRQARLRCVSAPTGVGFCMGMNRQAIAEVGLLDDQAYGRGFGEENDWCQRAIKKGYRNVQVENLFVYHKHGGSFVSAEKEQLMQQHLEILKKRFPSYDWQVRKFIKADANQKLRQLMQMLIDTHETKSVLFFDHSLGGGATAYVDTRKDELFQEFACVSTIRYRIGTDNYRFEFENGRERLEYEFSEFKDIMEIGKWLHFDEIYVNELVTYPKLWDVQEWILKFKEQQQAELIMLFHDFFAICPTINLLNPDRQYCGMPGEEDCSQCYLQHGLSGQYGCDRKGWIQQWGSFLKECNEVRTFSHDTWERVRAVYGEELNLTIVGHQVDYAFPINKDCKTTDTLNIGLLGVLATHKGSGLVRELLKEIGARKQKVRITLIGQCDGINLKKYPEFEETGRYNTSQLPELIYQHDIDIFLISSIWPETFSYTAEEIMKMGMPIAAFPLGAPAERISSYEKGLILKGNRPAEILEQICDFAENQLKLPEQRVEYKKVVYVAEYISFSSRYRMEHMQEELMHQGVPGELWKTKSLPKNIDWSKIGAMVIYRCRYREPLKKLMAAARMHGIRILYDIDDYIFEYKEICQLPLMEEKEFQDSETYSRLIRECMEACDGILVSTDHLKAAAQQTFPGKGVYVNRNVASTQMLILSVLARKKRRPVTGRVVLGYFSGSNTHNRDFGLISDVLLEFMQKHEEVYLKIVGCLKLPEGFLSVKDRIINVDFVDWQELPDEIASVDINLMPLEDTFFNACKSENKWMEAALVKVPTIGSYNEEVANATRPGENIVLCKTAKEWTDALELLAGDENLRNQIAYRAFTYTVAYKTTLHKNRSLLQFVMEEENGKSHGMGKK